MSNWAVPLDFIGYPGLTREQSLQVHWAIQNGTALPPYTPRDIVQQQKQNRQSGGRRMKYKSTRRRGKTTRRRVKTHRRRHRKH